MTDAHNGEGPAPDTTIIPPENPAPIRETPPPGRRHGVAFAVLGALVLALAIVGSAPFWAPPLFPVLPWGPAQTQPIDLAPLADRLARLEAQAKQPSAPAPADTRALDALGQRIVALEQRGAAASAAPDLNPIEDSVQKLAARLDDDERKLGQIATTAASEDASDRLLLAAVAELRAAIEGGGPYQGERDAVAALGQGDADIGRALAPLGPGATTGLPSAALLAERFRDETAPAIRRAAAAAPAADSGDLSDRMLARVRGLVTIKRIGGDDGDPVSAPVAAARAALDKGDLAGTIAALQPLDGAPGDAAKPFVAAAQARLDAETAVASLGQRVTARILGAPRQPAQDNR